MENDKITALAQHLETSPDEITNNDYCFTVNPHKKKSGSGPGEIRNTADMLRERLDAGTLRLVTRQVNDALGAWYDLKQLYRRKDELAEHVKEERSRKTKDYYLRDELRLIEELEEAIKEFAARAETIEKKGHELYKVLEELVRKDGDRMHDGVNALYHSLWCSFPDSIRDRLAPYMVELSQAVINKEYQPEDIREEYDADDGEYLVLTDEEADEAQDEQLEQYLDDCILPDLPETMGTYFDREAWKSDARGDGRGHCLSSYDGEEHSETVDGETYYIYRIG